LRRGLTVTTADRQGFGFAGARGDEDAAGIADARVEERSRSAGREREMGERRETATSLNAFVFAFTSARLASNTAVRPNCHRASDGRTAERSRSADSSEIMS